MSLETGRIVEVQEKLDNGWWRGVTGGNEGWFPATFVKEIDGIYKFNYTILFNTLSNIPATQPLMAQWIRTLH